jgi:hypothetical protein
MAGYGVLRNALNVLIELIMVHSVAASVNYKPRGIGRVLRVEI